MMFNLELDLIFVAKQIHAKSKIEIKYQKISDRRKKKLGKVPQLTSDS